MAKPDPSARPVAAKATPLPRAQARPGSPPVATGPGPGWLRFCLAGLAGLYFVGLLHHPVNSGWRRPAAFFTTATALFPHADEFALEFRLEGWACGRRWEALDPRPYFPIEPDDKESRFQRLGYFYEHNRTVMQALDSYIVAHHAAGADDGVAGSIGGIRLVKVLRPLPPIGDPVERYHFDPFAAVPPEQRKDGYATPAAERKRRCTGT